MQTIIVALKQGTLTNEGGVLTGSASTLKLSMWETKVCTILGCQKKLALNNNQKELWGFKNYFTYKKIDTRKPFALFFPAKWRKNKKTKNHTAPIQVIYIEVLNSGTKIIPALNLWVQWTTAWKPEWTFCKSHWATNMLSHRCDHFCESTLPICPWKSTAQDKWLPTPVKWTKGWLATCSWFQSESRVIIAALSCGSYGAQHGAIKRYASLMCCQIS